MELYFVALLWEVEILGCFRVYRGFIRNTPMFFYLYLRMMGGTVLGYGWSWLSRQELMGVVKK